MSTILSQLKPLKIGDLTAKLPIIQGGMGVGISLSSLAGAVAGAGGIGIISTAQIGFREPDFAEHPQEANLRAIGSELQKARAIAKGGIVGFNIMVATKNYAEYVKTAVKARHVLPAYVSKAHISSARSFIASPPPPSCRPLSGSRSGTR